jgi:diguanylate cyclase (GGDEF)-like protein
VRRGGADRRGSDQDGRGLQYVEEFERALAEGVAARAETVAKGALDSGLSVEEVYSGVIAPAMVRIGDRWQSGEVSIAGEHLATAISQGVMARLFPTLLHGELRSRQRVMLAAVQGEQHILGLRMFADTLEGAGFDVRYLGPDVPLAALLEACQGYLPAVLGMTVSMWLNVPMLVSEIEEVAKLEQPPAVFVGGRAVGRAAQTGLDVPVVAGCEEVVEAVTSMIDRPRQGPSVRAALAARIPPYHPRSRRAGDGAESVARSFAVTALAAADTAREASRRAFELEALAFRDGLTGLWNRRAYDDRMIEVFDGEGQSGSALMLDVDEFKTINDTYGHEAGDEALVAVGRAILKCIRPSDFGARFGGDEFVVLLPDMDTGDATTVAERIRAEIEADLSDPAVTVSIGVADLAEDPRRTSLSIDQALYQAKRGGRNQVAAAGG